MKEPYRIVFNKVRDMLNHDFIGLPEVPTALMIGNSAEQQLMEVSLFAVDAKQPGTLADLEGEEFLHTLTQINAYSIRADFVLSYQEIRTLPGMLIEGCSLEEIERSAQECGGLENHKLAMDILLISLETIEGDHYSEMCPIRTDGAGMRRLDAWEVLKDFVPEHMDYVLNICREPDTLPKYEAFMERLNTQPEASEMN